MVAKQLYGKVVDPARLADPATDLKRSLRKSDDKKSANGERPRVECLYF